MTAMMLHRPDLTLLPRITAPAQSKPLKSSRSRSSSVWGAGPSAQRTVRQIAHRARAHVAARRPRDVASPTQTWAALEALQRAFETGDLQSLLDILAPDVVALGDGGGVKQAVPRPVVGADRVARLVAVGWDHVGAQTSFEPVQVNGCPALIMRLHGELDGVMAVRVEDGLIAGLYYVRNPQKLSRMERETAVSR